VNSERNFAAGKFERLRFLLKCDNQKGQALKLHTERAGIWRYGYVGVRFFSAFARQVIFRASGWRRVPLNLVQQLLL